MLSMSMQQALDADDSCQKVVNGRAVQRAAYGLKRCSPRTAWMTSGTEPFDFIVQSRVGHRPGRIGPRQRKRRPKPYPWLKKHRALAHDDILLHGRPQRPEQVPFDMRDLPICRIHHAANCRAAR